MENGLNSYLVVVNRDFKAPMKLYIDCEDYVNKYLRMVPGFLQTPIRQKRKLIPEILRFINGLRINNQTNYNKIYNMKRRDFLQSTAAFSAFTLISPSTAFGSKANSAIRIGLIGCGARGTSVITSMSNHTNINIIAMADIFRDKLDNAKKILDDQNIKKGFPAVVNKTHMLGQKHICNS